uniref:Endosome-associated-trafficking regulator 1 n=1 Tax=Monopterus albus TaxID=43700 RepID=A0A3Q3Q2F5_MONAL|nr:serologically defined colon cancer antigen 3 isoform X1 [Monopterus albus]
MSKHRNCAKTLIIADDEEVGAEELNPFSFREFLRWKEQDQDQEEDQDQTLSKSSSSPRLFDVGGLTFDPGVRSCCFFDPSLAPQEEEEEEWGRSFQSGIGNTSSLCAEDEEKETWFISKPDVQRGGGGGGENYEGDDETSMAEPVASCRGRSCQVQQLQEENLLLRRTVSELQRRSDADEHRLSELSEELQQRRRQEEKEAQDLEGMVHSVEQNLHLMTKRAVKAENSVSKMKVELQQLQVEVNSLRAENDRLKAAESQVVMTMRQNVQVASEYLNKMSCHAHSSIRQLLEEAETLRLVCQLLQSIDKISNLSTEA